MPAGSISLFPPYDDENQPLALRPILIAGMQAPVEDGDGGINIKTATDYPEGLLCAINPYLSPMKEGDKLEIHYNGGKILERWVAADEVDQRVFFYLPAPEQSEWIEDCHYVLTQARPYPTRPRRPCGYGLNFTSRVTVIKSRTCPMAIQS